MKLFSEKDQAYYLFRDGNYEDGVCCYRFNFELGERKSSLFNNEQAIDYLAKTEGSIVFRKLPETVILVSFRGMTYGDYYGKNFASVVGSLVEETDETEEEETAWLDTLADSEGEIRFFNDCGIIMADLWTSDRRGSFKYTNANKFIKLVEKFNANI